jgi:transposase
MADVACRFSKMAHVPFLFSTMEREKGERPQPVGRGFKNVVGRTRQNLGRDKETRFLIVDAQSVKNTDTAQEKGYDAGKKVSGIKRHIAVDTNGLPHMIHLTTADAPDRAAAIAGLAAYREGLGKVEKVLADGGYAGDPFAASVRDLLGAGVQIAKRNELHTFAVIPKRWVVERSFA